MTKPDWTRRYRTIWLSDIHLGTRACKAERLLDFLRCHRCATLYLVGDIIDGWRLRRNWYWDRSHNSVVQTFLRMAQNGTAVKYLPGNHDEFARDFLDVAFGDIEIADECIHETADGRRLLVLHGDRFDHVVTHQRWLAMLGDHAYRFTLALNHLFNLARRGLGFSYWSLAGCINNTVKNAASLLDNFEAAMLEEARRRRVDGIVCGHTHHAQIREIGGIAYYNDGDWVDSCTALVEHFDGRIEIVRWLDHAERPLLSMAS